MQLNKELSEDVKSCNLRNHYLLSRFEAVNKDYEAVQGKLKDSKLENDKLRQEIEELKQERRMEQASKSPKIKGIKPIKNKNKGIKPPVMNNNNKGEKHPVPVITLD